MKLPFIKTKAKILLSNDKIIRFLFINANMLNFLKPYKFTIMSNKITTLLMACLGIVLFFSSCQDKCEETITRTVYTPVYMSYEDAQSSVASKEARDLEDPGKIYFYNDYVLINERSKGVHVINNADPANPQNIAFIEIPGNIDIAMRNGFLYADMAQDLYVIHIADPTNATLVEVIEDVMPFPDYGMNRFADPSQGVVIDWLEEEIVETVEFNCGNSGSIGGWGNTFEATVDMATPSVEAGAPNNDSGGEGGGGSMARFALHKDKLYVVTQSDLLTFGIDGGIPVQEETVNIGWWGIETVFPYKDYLFIGSQNGMFIYDVSNPSAPVQLSMFQHIQSCDPVVANDEYAYVTLRGGNPCGNDINRLDILDISDVNNPVLEKTYGMVNPYGLGLDGSTLFVCDDGLKVFDVTDPNDIDELEHYSNIEAYDVIPRDGLLMVIGADGFYQYNYENVNDLQLLSRIDVM